MYSVVGNAIGDIGRHIRRSSRDVNGSWKLLNIKVPYTNRDVGERQDDKGKSTTRLIVCSRIDSMLTEVLIAVIVGSFTLLGVYIGGYLDEKRERKRFLRSLLDEISLNSRSAQKTLLEISFNRIDKMTLNETDNEKELRPPYCPFHTLSYQNIRASGYLVDLDREMRIQLEDTFNKIYKYNQDEGYKAWHEESLTMLVSELENLNEDMQKLYKRKGILNHKTASF